MDSGFRIRNGWELDCSVRIVFNNPALVTILYDSAICWFFNNCITESFCWRFIIQSLITCKCNGTITYTVCKCCNIIIGNLCSVDGCTILIFQSCLICIFYNVLNLCCKCISCLIIGNFYMYKINALIVIHSRYCRIRWLLFRNSVVVISCGIILIIRKCNASVCLILHCLNWSIFFNCSICISFCNVKWKFTILKC